MKNVSFFLITFLCITNVWSQKNFVLNPFPQVESKSSYNYVPQTDSEITLTWLTTNDMVTAYGGVASTISVFMEFSPGDMINFNNTGKKPTSIKQVQFHIRSDYASTVTSGKIVIRKGADLASSTVEVSQATSIIGGWNHVDLQTDYTIDPTQNLYIGYEVTYTDGGNSSFPLSVANGNETKQGWILSNGTVTNLTDLYDYVFMIKAIASAEDSPANEIAMQLISVPSYLEKGETQFIQGVVKNLGIMPLTSFTLKYSVDGTTSSPYHVTGVNIAPNAVYTVTHPDQVTFDKTKSYMLSVSVSKPNETDDELSNNTKSMTVQVYSSIVQRVLLHESFTSSTCGPCKAGNQKLESVLNNADETKWVNIRYQMSWPTPGDPYYTEEGGVRQGYYEVNSVPYLVVDGLRYNNPPNAYSNSIFNQLEEAPAIVGLSGVAETDSKTVGTKITITPATSMNTQNLRLFAAIVEKRTTKNIKSNGESEFLYVMKKFMTNVAGDPIGNFVDGESQAMNLNYTFNGDYRLPANANSPINHAINHSVEDFKNLMVVYWIQDIRTKEVYQAGKTDATFKTGIDLIRKADATACIYDGSLYINSDAAVLNIDIYNIAGRKVLSTATGDKVVPVETLPHGVYVVKVKTTQGDETVKVIR
jgi:hypothetical protein